MGGKTKDHFSQGKIYTKSIMNTFFFEDPINGEINRKFGNIQLKYFYFDSELILKTEKNEVLNGCLLLGNGSLIHNDNKLELNQYDFFFIPPENEYIINVKSKSNNKIILLYSPTEKEIDTDFEIKQFHLKNFINRGEFSSIEKMSSYREVWTAIDNGFFLSGITNIPKESLKTGVITSVNLEGNKIYSHIHPNYPEVYIFLIDDDNYAITQYLINSEGQSICKDLTNGEGVFFPGNLGHCNFAKPNYKDLKYCMYIWLIPTFGKKGKVEPITLKV